MRLYTAEELCELSRKREVREVIAKVSGAVATITWLHAALWYGQFDYSRGGEASSVIFVVTPLVGLVGWLVASLWKSK